MKERDARSGNRLKHILKGARFMPRGDLSTHIIMRLSGTSLVGTGALMYSQGEALHQGGATTAAMGLAFIGGMTALSEYQYFKIQRTRNTSVRPEMLKPQEDTMQNFSRRMRRLSKKGLVSIYQINQDTLIHLEAKRDINWEMKSYEHYDMVIITKEDGYQSRKHLYVSRSRSNTHVMSLQSTTDLPLSGLLPSIEAEEERKRLDEDANVATDAEMREAIALLEQAKKKNRTLYDPKTGRMVA